MRFFLVVFVLVLIASLSHSYPAASDSETPATEERFGGFGSFNNGIYGAPPSFGGFGQSGVSSGSFGQSGGFGRPGGFGQTISTIVRPLAQGGLGLLSGGFGKRR